jgi:hypothetical protein
MLIKHGNLQTVSIILMSKKGKHNRPAKFPESSALDERLVGFCTTSQVPPD